MFLCSPTNPRRNVSRSSTPWKNWALDKFGRLVTYGMEKTDHDKHFWTTGTVWVTVHQVDKLLVCALLNSKTKLRIKVWASFLLTLLDQSSSKWLFVELARQVWCHCRSSRPSCPKKTSFLWPAPLRFDWGSFLNTVQENHPFHRWDRNCQAFHCADLFGPIQVIDIHFFRQNQWLVCYWELQALRVVYEP